MLSNLGAIDITPEHIGHALTDKIIRVPINQRDFSWEADHVTELYEDFQTAIDQSASEYFLGSIVVLRQDKHFEVVDGQQRLATSVILLAAIRDYIATKLDKEAAKKFARRYLFKEELSGQDIPRLTLNDRDHPFFLNRVLLPPDDERRRQVEDGEPREKKTAQRRIERAAKIAAKKVKSILSGLRQPDKQLAALEKWVNFIEEKATVIWVTVPDESAAYVIFETMNDRGLALSAADLIKNYLFGRAQEDLETVKSHWFRMVGALDTLNDSKAVLDYIRHYWIALYGRVPETQLFGALKNRLRSSPEECFQFVQQIEENCSKYVAIASANESFWKKHGNVAKDSIKTLKTLGIVQTRPLILAMLMKQWNDKELSTVLLRAISWTVRLFAAKTQGTGTLEASYAEAAIKVSRGEFKNAKDVSVHMEKSISPDPKFEQDFLQFEVGKPSLARYYLHALEKRQIGESEPYFETNKNPDEIDTEHVMPKEPNEEWGHISADEHETYVNRLGNMALVKASVNRSLGKEGQRKFDVKRTQYAKSSYSLTKEIGSYNDWNGKTIDDRQKRLAALAVRTWPLRAPFRA